MMTSRRFAFLIVILVLLFIGCVPPQPQTPKQVYNTNFTYEPPSTAQSKCNMTIAIIKPQTSGTMFSDVLISSGPDMRRALEYGNDMLKAAKGDMEKILIAKGFNTLGPFESIDEMTYSEKERASLLYVPIFDANMDFMGGNVAQGTPGTVSQQASINMRGSVSLAFLEPMTREKVWMKRFDLEPYTESYVASAQTSPADPLSAAVNQALFGGAQQNQKTQLEAATLVLNNFYQKAMSKMWDHLDQREIQQLKTETEKLKKLKRY
jgi:hypothetical protein